MENSEIYQRLLTELSEYESLIDHGNDAENCRTRIVESIMEFRRLDKMKTSSMRFNQKLLFALKSVFVSAKEYPLSEDKLSILREGVEMLLTQIEANAYKDIMSRICKANIPVFIMPYNPE